MSTIFDDRTLKTPNMKRFQIPTPEKQMNGAVSPRKILQLPVRAERRLKLPGELPLLVSCQLLPRGNVPVEEIVQQKIAQLEEGLPGRQVPEQGALRPLPLLEQSLPWEGRSDQCMMRISAVIFLRYNG
jgi:hypothetical protein